VSQLKAIVGLGNPGERYVQTRHNIGFMVVDALARQSGKGIWEREHKSLTCRSDLGGHEVLLAKPLTYMNLSGRALEAILLGCGLSMQDIVIVLDDLNLPFGILRIRERGSSGGHRGLESILEVLGGEEVPRVRIGIGEENIPPDKAAFVLSEFSPDRARDLNELISRAASAVSMVVTDGVSKAMSVFNA
jgi:PTH1 family peptidyl-tRNA hydrolase